MITSLLIPFFYTLIDSNQIENRNKIAVIDTGIRVTEQIKPYLCRGSHVDFTNTDLFDRVGHGTNVSNIIIKDIDSDKNCILIIKWTDFSAETTSIDSIVSALLYSINNNVKYINLSLGGRKANLLEEKLIRIALNKKIKVVTAAGNSSLNLNKDCSIFPACYKFNNNNFFVVANFLNHKRYYNSNYNGPVNAKENGVEISAGGFVLTGTSQSAAIFLNKLIKKDTDETKAL